MDFVDGWLLEHFDANWSLEYTQEKTKEAIEAFLKDSTDYDEEVIEEVLGTITPVESNCDDVGALVDTLVEMAVITEREELYIRRMVKIVYCFELTHEELLDSVAVFVDDVRSGVDWEEDEIACLSFTSILDHSLEYWQSGWKFDPGNPTLDFDWGRCGGADVRGGIAGWRAMPSWQGIVVGAACFSAFNALEQLWD